MDAVVHGPGEGERHGVGTSELVIKATGADTGDSFFLSETTIAPAFPGPPPHVHERLHDMLTPETIGRVASRYDFRAV